MNATPYYLSHFVSHEVQLNQIESRSKFFCSNCAADMSAITNDWLGWLRVTSFKELSFQLLWLGSLFRTLHIWKLVQISCHKSGYLHCLCRKASVRVHARSGTNWMDTLCRKKSPFFGKILAQIRCELNRLRKSFTKFSAIGIALEPAYEDLICKTNPAISQYQSANGFAFSTTFTTLCSKLLSYLMNYGEFYIVFLVCNYFTSGIAIKCQPV